MVSGTRAAHNIEITAESLQEELARLEVQKQALERELAAVVAHLGSVQRALSALEGLMHTAPESVPVGAARVAAAGVDQASAPAKPQPDLASSTPADGAPKKAAPRIRQPESRRDAKERSASDAADGQRKYGELTEQILEYFGTVGQADVRARDVAAALGRDADNGSINAVRSTLDRLVGTSRIRRTGRGLYRATRS
ncbi:hypothetical protein [Streptomyces siamensis]|uniref:Uncharacterized protein n=1 Tax=Streptomyces siamensis TaxID=1274986 RepID=A0ABP9JA00_9ACTN